MRSIWQRWMAEAHEQQGYLLASRLVRLCGGQSVVNLLVLAKLPDK